MRRRGPAPRAPDGIDAVLLSHLHYDHLDLPWLGRIAPRPRLLVPVGAGSFLRRSGFDRVEELAPGGSARVDG